MLPPGHAAGGYLLARLVLLFIPFLVDPAYLLYSALFSIVPDLDYLAIFAKSKSLNLKATDAGSHRHYLTHAPLVYVLVYTLWLLLFPQTAIFAHAFITGTWSHFFLDSFAPSQYGIKWLYPFSEKDYSFNLDKPFEMLDGNPWKFWFSFMKGYVRVFTFKLELILIALALLVRFAVR